MVWWTREGKKIPEKLNSNSMEEKKSNSKHKQDVCFYLDFKF